ncbi:ATP-binding cassette domain-containing protein, partial [Lysinibacillus sp. D4B1_S16]
MKTVLENACVTVPKGHLAAIIGPNGAGKSTFLKAMFNELPN